MGRAGIMEIIAIIGKRIFSSKEEMGNENLAIIITRVNVLLGQVVNMTIIVLIVTRQVTK